MPSLEFGPRNESLGTVKLGKIEVRRPVEAGPYAHLYESARVMFTVPSGVSVGTYFPLEKELTFTTREEDLRHLLRNSRRLYIPDSIVVDSTHNHRLTIRAEYPFSKLITWFYYSHDGLPMMIRWNEEDTATCAGVLLDGKPRETVPVFVLKERPVRVGMLRYATRVFVPPPSSAYDPAIAPRSTEAPTVR